MKVNGLTVILADGEFPRRGSRAFEALATAKRVIACDGAANAYRRRFGQWPTYTIGDLDSLSRRGQTPLPEKSLIRVDDQETNDLTKAIDFARGKGWRRLVIVGATGKREDHTIGNIFRGVEAQIPILAEKGVFYPVCGRAVFRVAVGAAISIFAPDPLTHVSSKGLVWPLEGVTFDTLYRGTLNRASAARVEIVSNRKIYVYIAE